MNQTLDFASYFENFSLAYGYLDVDSVIAFYALPFKTQINNECCTWTEHNQLHDTLTALYGWMKKQGFHQPRYEIISAQHVDENTARATLRWDVIKNDGATMSYFNTYKLQLIANQWKITGIIRSELEALHLIEHSV